MKSNRSSMARNSHSHGNDHGLISVCVARFSSIGDVAMSVPVIYSVCATYPDVRFIFVTRHSMADIFVNSPTNLIVVGVDFKTDYTGVSGMHRLVGELAEDYHVDIFIDLQNELHTRMMRFFWRMKGVKSLCIDKGNAGKRALTRRNHKRMLPLISQRARYREAFFNAGLPVSDSFKGLFGGHCKASAKIFENITAPKKPGEKWVGIAPFAAHIGKSYPIDRTTEALRMIRAKHPDVRFFFFGGGGEEHETLELVASEFEGSVSLAGKHYGFATELALINHLDVMLTMDSANMHLASIASTPTVSIWGATHPYCGFKGWRQSESDIMQLPMTCRPCSVFGNKPCHRGDYMCLTAIKPAKVAEKIIEKIS